MRAAAVEGARHPGARLRAALSRSWNHPSQGEQCARSGLRALGILSRLRAALSRSSVHPCQGEQCARSRLRALGILAPGFAVLYRAHGTIPAKESNERGCG